jgi:hypothetical protein
VRTEQTERARDAQKQRNNTKSAIRKRKQGRVKKALQAVSREERRERAGKASFKGPRPLHTGERRHQQHLAFAQQHGRGAHGGRSASSSGRGRGGGGGRGGSSGSGNGGGGRGQSL